MAEFGTHPQHATEQPNYGNLLASLSPDVERAFARLHNVGMDAFSPETFTSSAIAPQVAAFMTTHPTPESFWPAMNVELHRAQVEREAPRRRVKETPQVVLTEQVISAAERMAVGSENGARTINRILAQYGLAGQDAFSLQAVDGNEKALPAELLNALKAAVGELSPEEQTQESWVMRTLKSAREALKPENWNRPNPKRVAEIRRNAA